MLDYSFSFQGKSYFFSSLSFFAKIDESGKKEAWKIDISFVVINLFFPKQDKTFVFFFFFFS